jgi:plasmid maintenance system antidote protein VapI
LYSEDVEPEEMVEEAARDTTGEMATVQELIQEANQAFESYLNLQQQMEFEKASRKMRKLRETLQKLSEQADTQESGSGGKKREQSQ